MKFHLLPYRTDRYNEPEDAYTPSVIETNIPPRSKEPIAENGYLWVSSGFEAGKERYLD